MCSLLLLLHTGNTLHLMHRWSLCSCDHVSWTFHARRRLCVYDDRSQSHETVVTSFWQACLVVMTAVLTVTGQIQNKLTLFLRGKDVTWVAHTRLQCRRRCQRYSCTTSKAINNTKCSTTSNSCLPKINLFTNYKYIRLPSKLQTHQCLDYTVPFSSTTIISILMAVFPHLAGSPSILFHTCSRTEPLDKVAQVGSSFCNPTNCVIWLLKEETLPHTPAVKRQYLRAALTYWHWTASVWGSVSSLMSRWHCWRAHASTATGAVVTD